MAKANCQSNSLGTASLPLPWPELSRIRLGGVGVWVCPRCRLAEKIDPQPLPSLPLEFFKSRLHQANFDPQSRGKICPQPFNSTIKSSHSRRLLFSASPSSKPAANSCPQTLTKSTNSHYCTATGGDIQSPPALRICLRASIAHRCA